MTDRSARLQRLYRLSVAADDAYQAELEHVYGATYATAARYHASRNRATPMLDMLHTVKTNADAARHAASEELLTAEYGTGPDAAQLATTHTGV